QREQVGAGIGDAATNALATDAAVGPSPATAPIPERPGRIGAVPALAALPAGPAISLIAIKCRVGKDERDGCGIGGVVNGSAFAALSQVAGDRAEDDLHGTAFIG